MSLEPKKKKITYFEFDNFIVEFEGDNYSQDLNEAVSFYKDQMRFITDSKISTIPREDRAILDKSIFRYGHPISVDLRTKWAIDLLMRSVNNNSRSSDKMSVSKLLEGVIRSVSCNTDTDNKYFEGLVLGSALTTDSIKVESSSMRKYVMLSANNENKQFEVFYVPDLTFHKIGLLRKIFLALVSPELLTKTEKEHVFRFLIDLKDNQDLVNSKINFDSSGGMLAKIIAGYEIDLLRLHDICESIREKQLKNILSDKNWYKPEVVEFAQELFHFTFLEKAGLKSLQIYFDSLRRISNKFGTISYNKEIEENNE